VFTKVCGYDDLTVVTKEQEEEDSSSKERRTAALINTCRNEHSIAGIYLGHENVNANMNIGPCNTQDTNQWNIITVISLPSSFQ